MNLPPALKSLAATRQLQRRLLLHLAEFRELLWMEANGDILLAAVACPPAARTEVCQAELEAIILERETPVL